MFLAFESIRLGKIDWKTIIAKATNMTDRRHKKDLLEEATPNDQQ
jgi:hypothetical protein